MRARTLAPDRLPRTSLDWTPERIRALRKRHKLSQEAFAPHLGFSSKSRVSELETGASAPSDQVVLLLEHINAHGLLPTPS